jgi:hypothetical protein
MCIQNFIKLLKISKGYRLNDLISIRNNLTNHGDDVTHPQLLVGLKCESQTENNERTRSRSAFPGS